MNVRDYGRLPDGTPYFAPLGEIRYDPEEDRVQCHLCGRWYRVIAGSHLHRVHGWTLEEYREAFRLMKGVPTVAAGVSAALAAHTRRRVQTGELPADFSPEWRARRDTAARYRVQRWRSLAVVRPDLASELHPRRNGELDPSALAPTSSRRVWWRCGRYGHEWERSVGARARGDGCRECARRAQIGRRVRVRPGKSLAELSPDLAAEFHPTRNGDLDPYAVARWSVVLVWCRCTPAAWPAAASCAVTLACGCLSGVASTGDCYAVRTAANAIPGSVPRGGPMARDADLEIGLRWRGESFEVNLGYDDPDDIADKEQPGEVPILIDVAKLEDLANKNKIEAYGEALADMLFGTETKVKSFYDKARAVAQEKNLPVHFRIYVDPAAPAEYSTVRWETLLDPEDKQPVATKRNLMLSRFLKSADWRQVTLPKKHELRALVVIANPSDAHRLGYRLPTIDVDDELERAHAALGAIPSARLPSDGAATLDRIADALDERVDILYLVCHGVIVEGKPLLFLERSDARTELVDAPQLAQRIAELEHRPTLAVLNSCASAGPGERAETTDDSALAPLGPSLVNAGIPAVVAMQGKVTIKTAGLFLSAFFKALSRDGIVDRAVAVARGEVRERRDWWVPVLYSRLKKGRTYWDSGFAEEAEFKWQALVEGIAAKECTPVLGPGLAAPLIGSREQVARRWVDRWQMPIAEDNRGDLTTVAQYLRVRTGARLRPTQALRSHLVAELRERWAGQLTPEQLAADAPEQLIAARGAQVMEENPDEVHLVLARLRLPIYITTSWTGLLEQAIEHTGVEPTVRVFDWLSTRDSTGAADFEEPTPERPLVYHLFGRLEQPRSIVLSEDDYFAWLTAWIAKRDVIPTAVRAALTNSSLLFLGHRLSAWDFRVLFQSIKSFAGAGLLRDNVHVGVQFSPDSQAIDPEAAQDYLESALGEDNISIYWEDTDVFLEELIDRSAG